jgi:DNA sulfur modification protein DndE
VAEETQGIVENVVIYMIGDSTMADKPLMGNPERGWGQLLRIYCMPNIEIRNHAMNGRSTRSFLAEGRWQKVLDELKSGDYVIIQFGHNDSKVKTERYAEALTAYKTNLARYVDETRAKGATPILAPPINRRRFSDDGKFFDTHADYPVACRQVAQEMNVPLLEMHKLSEELIVRHGVEGSKALFLWIAPGICDRCPEGKEDDTHFGAYGASRMAEIAIQEMRRLGLPFAKYFRD